MELLINAKFVTGNVQIFGGGRKKIVITGITWEGYELLDTIRNQGVWDKMKAAVAPIGNVPIEIIKSLGVEFIKRQIMP